MTQLVEQPLLTPKIRGSNPVIAKIYVVRLLSTVLKFEKTKMKEIDVGNGSFLKQFNYQKPFEIEHKLTSKGR